MKEHQKQNPFVARLSRTLNSFIDRIAAVLGALIFAQIPQFMAQYIQRLGGHVDELKLIMSKYTTAARASKLGLDEYIKKHLNSPTEVFKNTGKIMQESQQRLEILTKTLNELTTATPYTKFFYFIKGIFKDIFNSQDANVFKGTYKDFTPGIPTTGEGLAYAVIGIFVALLLYYMLKKALQKIFKKIFNKIRNKKKPKPQSPGNFSNQQYTQLDDFDFKDPY